MNWSNPEHVAKNVQGSLSRQVAGAAVHVPCCGKGRFPLGSCSGRVLLKLKARGEQSL